MVHHSLNLPAGDAVAFVDVVSCALDMQPSVHQDGEQTAPVDE